MEVGRAGSGEVGRGGGGEYCYKMHIDVSNPYLSSLHEKIGSSAGSFVYIPSVFCNVDFVVVVFVVVVCFILRLCFSLRSGDNHVEYTIVKLECDCYNFHNFPVS